MKKFRDVLSRWEAGELSMMEAGELLGMSERQFRRYRGRYEDDGAEGPEAWHHDASYAINGADAGIPAVQFQLSTLGLARTIGDRRRRGMEICPTQLEE